MVNCQHSARCDVGQAVVCAIKRQHRRLDEIRYKGEPD